MSIIARSGAYGITIVALLLASGCANTTPARELTILQESPLYAFNEHEVDVYLKWLHAQESDVPGRVVHLARKNIGQPYRIFLLGEFPYELHDPDPLYCLSASDCVTFVEQTYAMALAEDWPSFFRTLQRIRYRNGYIGIRTRNHFTEADWNVNNRWLFEDVTDSVGGRQTRPYTLQIDRRAFFQRFGVDSDLQIEEFSDLYVPRDALSGALSELRDADIIEFVRGPSDAPYVGHMGLIARDPDGRITLIHSTKPRVREESLEYYFARRPELLGFKVLRPRERPRWSWTVEVLGASR